MTHIVAETNALADTEFAEQYIKEIRELYILEQQLDTVIRRCGDQSVKIFHAKDSHLWRHKTIRRVNNYLADIVFCAYPDAIRSPIVYSGAVTALFPQRIHSVKWRVDIFHRKTELIGKLELNMLVFLGKTKHNAVKAMFLNNFKSFFKRYCGSKIREHIKLHISLPAKSVVEYKKRGAKPLGIF